MGAFICNKPAGSCKGCEHYRYDADYEGMSCFAAADISEEIENEIRSCED